MEKKKRFRPTLGAYRALEDEVSRLREELRLCEREKGYPVHDCESGCEETVHMLVQESDAWREKYRSLDEECRTLKVSNEHMEREVARLNEKLRERVDKIRDLETDIYVLKNRGFWARVFNRE